MTLDELDSIVGEIKEDEILYQFRKNRRKTKK